MSGTLEAEAISRTRLPAATFLTELTPHADERGVFTELFRASWPTAVHPVQWNMVTSEPGVLRGVHVHPRHDDYLMIARGRASVGLRDLRRGSPTHGLSTVVEMRGDRPMALSIPHGVAHGFYFHEPSIHIYAVSHYWDPADELACHWADPDLELGWRVTSPTLSPRDRLAPPLGGLLQQLEPFQPFR
ncbi:MAG: dTDP-4-dehydrorhamnose 3,5-epimerase family protein [Holophagales bacterium]|nr:dTDP-4-dehydrorhamnose 3,5-epimerase family protein [Holophagales bacterium]